MLSGLHQEVRYDLITSLLSSANEQLLFIFDTLYLTKMSVSQTIQRHMMGMKEAVVA
jgi:hypothetical protein